MDLTWKHLFTSLVAGPTGCGKTEWVIRFITHVNELMCPAPARIIYSYSEWQPSYWRLPSTVELVEGIPILPECSDDSILLVVDDQMDKINADVSRLFTKGSHHRNISVIYIVQNVFDKNKDFRTVSLNTHYLVVFNNPRDRTQVVHLAKQMYPGQTDYVKDAFSKAVKNPYGYLLVDLKQTTPDTYRLRSYIFPGENQEVYLPST